MWEDVRSVHSQEYRELQSLYEDSQLQLKQVSLRSPVSCFRRSVIVQTAAVTWRHRCTGPGVQLTFVSLSLSSISVQQLKGWESSVSPPPSPSEGPLLSDVWSSVPPSYRGYRLGSLFGHRPEISHFKSFLEDHDAR